MKKLIILALAVGSLVLASCDDMLDKTPRDRFTNTPAFWSNENQVTSYLNHLYEDYVGYGHGTALGWFYAKSLSDDQASMNFENWTYTSVPGTSSYWSNGFAEVRRCNYAINGLAGSSLSSATRAKYVGIARLNRAYQYYQLVREYGDVQWENKVILDPADPEVYGTRTDRDVVMDSVLADLDYAIANIGNSSDKTQFSTDLALAMKSEVCLYEGTYCKYRTQAENGKAPDNARAQKYLEQCVDASNKLMTSGTYSLTANYGDIYNSLDLNGNKEVIFYNHFVKDVLMHSLPTYITSSTTQKGITRDAFEAFLFRDGKPLATTSLDKNDVPTIDAKGNYNINKLLAVRDKRLYVLIDSVACFKGHGWSRPYRDNTFQLPEMTSSTGYTIRKYDNTTVDSHARTEDGQCYTDAPLYWLAEIYLNYAEAKAELGTITQSDLDATVNKLLARGDVPALTLNPAADPANNMGVSNLIWEIRRCRRCELMTDNWIRYWDLVRWHQLDKIDTEKYPKVNLGAHVGADAGVNVDADGYMVPVGRARTFQAKYYFFPVPNGQIDLNKQTTQNPGW